MNFFKLNSKEEQEAGIYIDNTKKLLIKPLTPQDKEDYESSEHIRRVIKTSTILIIVMILGLTGATLYKQIKKGNTGKKIEGIEKSLKDTLTIAPDMKKVYTESLSEEEQDEFRQFGIQQQALHTEQYVENQQDTISSIDGINVVSESYEGGMRYSIKRELLDNMGIEGVYHKIYDHNGDLMPLELNIKPYKVTNITKFTQWLEDEGYVLPLLPGYENLIAELLLHEQIQDAAGDTNKVDYEQLVQMIDRINKTHNYYTLPYHTSLVNQKTTYQFDTLAVLGVKGSLICIRDGENLTWDLSDIKTGDTYEDLFSELFSTACLQSAESHHASNATIINILHNSPIEIQEQIRQMIIKFLIVGQLKDTSPHGSTLFDQFIKGERALFVKQHLGDQTTKTVSN